MKVGVFVVVTDDGIRPDVLSRALEDRGFESCFVGEHSHVPVHRETPGDAVARSLDPFVSLSAMAAVTTRIRLGTAVALVVQRDPIHLAKEVATLDLLSGGRVELGVGAGWLKEEMRNHGTDPATRFTLLRERVQAMKAIWTADEAEFHGELVSFDPIRQWPKPVQRPHPPILIGGAGPNTHRRVLDYGDGWMPTPMPMDDLAASIAALRSAAANLGRGHVPVTAMLADPTPDSLAAAQAAGADRALVMLPEASAEEAMHLIDRHAELLAHLPER
jgi:probable F420-dependent oxidoreductase